MDNSSKGVRERVIGKGEMRKGKMEREREEGLRDVDR